MTTLRKLQYQVDRLLSAGPKTRDSKLSPKYIQAEIVQVANSLIKKEHYQKMNSGERDVYALCIATYENLSVQESDDGRNYINLPAFPENLPGGYGLQQVRPQTGTDTVDRAMILIMPQEKELFYSLLVGQEVLKGQWCAELDRYKIWFSSKNESTLLEEGIDKVEVRMVVVDPATLDEDDPFPISPAQEMDVLREVLMLHGYSAREVADLVNDNIPTK